MISIHIKFIDTRGFATAGDAAASGASSPRRAISSRRLVAASNCSSQRDEMFGEPVGDVRELTPIEALLWNVKPCPGPPREYPGEFANALYRLLAYGVLKASEQASALRSDLPSDCNFVIRAEQNPVLRTLIGPSRFRL